METLEPKTIDDYIAQFPLATQKILQQLRESIQQAATNAKEVNKEINKIPSNDLLANQHSILAFFTKIVTIF